MCYLAHRPISNLSCQPSVLKSALKASPTTHQPKHRKSGQLKCIRRKFDVLNIMVVISLKTLSDYFQLYKHAFLVFFRNRCLLK